jgi:hypothetical protein
MTYEEIQNLQDKCNVVLSYLDGKISLDQFRAMLGLPPAKLLTP